MTHNKKISITASWMLMVSLTIFIVSLSLDLLFKSEVFQYISFASCMVLSWGFLGIIIGFKYTTKDETKSYVDLAMVFGLLYAFFINLVYYTQLTTVLHKNASEDVLRILAFSAPGSLMFNLDLLGYGFMALSTLFLGLSLDKEKSVLKRLLLIHGIFAICMIFPILPTTANEGNAGAYALIAWSIYFLPIGYLALKKFKRQVF